ncbi:hypothetical protein B0T09DRAFT_335361 [Sordaria sp. MPI-SDFR-AT-0083]|nr:hypothetical protein B0T09DRAFT_335361 [Sordaria sp. MPI-SDFR-AT-0083]
MAPFPYFLMPFSLLPLALFFFQSTSTVPVNDQSETMKTYHTDHLDRKGPDHEYVQDKENDPSCFITMSPIWASLPREIVGKILDDHITNHLPPPVPPRKVSDEWPNNTFCA